MPHSVVGRPATFVYELRAALGAELDPCAHLLARRVAFLRKAAARDPATRCGQAARPSGATARGNEDAAVATAEEAEPSTNASGSGRRGTSGRGSGAAQASPEQTARRERTARRANAATRPGGNATAAGVEDANQSGARHAREEREDAFPSTGEGQASPSLAARRGYAAQRASAATHAGEEAASEEAEPNATESDGSGRSAGGRGGGHSRLGAPGC